jgi:hypothetical protein
VLRLGLHPGQWRDSQAPTPVCRPLCRNPPLSCACFSFCCFSRESRPWSRTSKPWLFGYPLPLCRNYPSKPELITLSPCQPVPLLLPCLRIDLSVVCTPSSALAYGTGNFRSHVPPEAQQEPEGGDCCESGVKQCDTRWAAT